MLYLFLLGSDLALLIPCLAIDSERVELLELKVKRSGPVLVYNLFSLELSRMGRWISVTKMWQWCLQPRRPAHGRKPVSWRIQALAGIIRLTCADITFPFRSGSASGRGQEAQRVRLTLLAYNLMITVIKSFTVMVSPGKLINESCPSVNKTLFSLLVAAPLALTLLRQLLH